MSTGAVQRLVPERQRRHTLYFLEYAFARQRPVLIDTEIDMSAVAGHRAAARAAGHRFSLVSYVVWAGARAVAAHPEANAALTGRLAPRLAQYEGTTAKVALDKTYQGRRAVFSALVQDAERLTLEQIQRVVDRHRDGDAEHFPPFAGVRRINRLPAPVGRLLFRRLLSRPAGRRRVLGTFSVSCLGHRPVDSFAGAGGTAVTLNMGRMRERPWVKGGRLTVAPVMRLNLTFDHRVIDGALAADLLADIKASLEGFHDGTSADHPAAGTDRIPPVLERRP
ncbi:2-oxo acid dehydrogenase subunit E2 [Streptomyces sp. NPDC052101]|uniref:2-oxo acid dehydrogenase subunit E2 n=1 Tax=Streptomyces sp. NPDC052101 TaxID=3155763 RepID=UPI00344470E3